MWCRRARGRPRRRLALARAASALLRALSPRPAPDFAGYAAVLIYCARMLAELARCVGGYAGPCSARPSADRCRSTRFRGVHAVRDHANSVSAPDMSAGAPGEQPAPEDYLLQAFAEWAASAGQPLSRGNGHAEQVHGYENPPAAATPPHMHAYPAAFAARHPAAATPGHRLGSPLESTPPLPRAGQRAATPGPHYGKHNRHGISNLRACAPLPSCQSMLL